jgi:Cytochrome C oxidase, cbb3-type, subunit III
MILGIMDWQHFYQGAWILPIKVKLTVAPILAALLGLSVFLGRMYGATSLRVLPFYFLCLCAVTVLGYFGGQLTYAGRTISGPNEYKAGEQIYAASCTTCHPGGGNTIDPGKPLLHSPLLQNLDIFKMWLRHPALPMPPFSALKISDEQAKALYAYVQNVLNK